MSVVYILYRYTVLTCYIWDEILACTLNIMWKWVILDAHIQPHICTNTSIHTRTITNWIGACSCKCWSELTAVVTLLLRDFNLKQPVIIYPIKVCGLTESGRMVKEDNPAETVWRVQLSVARCFQKEMQSDGRTQRSWWCSLLLPVPLYIIISRSIKVIQDEQVVTILSQCSSSHGTFDTLTISMMSI